jgi:predicted Zn-dependent protease
VLQSRYDALLGYRDTLEGRSFPGVDAVLARLASVLGKFQAARAHQDADRRHREEGAAPWLARARSALSEGRLEEVEQALSEARALLPGDPRILHLAARLHRTRGDNTKLAAAFAELRRWAPSLDSAISTENRLREDLELPLLPERSAEDLIDAH